MYSQNYIKNCKKYILKCLKRFFTLFIFLVECVYDLAVNASMCAFLPHTHTNYNERTEKSDKNGNIALQPTENEK